jgi:hypothetical protein
MFAAACLNGHPVFVATLGSLTSVVFAGECSFTASFTSFSTLVSVCDFKNKFKN